MDDLLQLLGIKVSTELQNVLTRLLGVATATGVVTRVNHKIDRLVLCEVSTMTAVIVIGPNDEISACEDTFSSWVVKGLMSGIATAERFDRLGESWWSPNEDGRQHAYISDNHSFAIGWAFTPIIKSPSTSLRLKWIVLAPGADESKVAEKLREIFPEQLAD